MHGVARRLQYLVPIKGLEGTSMGIDYILGFRDTYCAPSVSVMGKGARAVVYALLEEALQFMVMALQNETKKSMKRTNVKLISNETHFIWMGRGDSCAVYPGSAPSLRVCVCAQR